MFAVVLGIGAGSGGVIALVQGMPIPDSGVPLWSDVALTGWVLSMAPWILFALQYTGRYTRFRWRTVAAITIPVLGLVGLVVFQSAGEVTVITQVLGTLSLLYVFALVAVGSYLLLRTTHEYGHLSLYQGLALAVAGIAPLVIINSMGPLIGSAARETVVGVYALAFLTPALALGLAVFRYETFESTPAAGALGERAIPRETDDLVIVVDRDGRVIKLTSTRRTNSRRSVRKPGRPTNSSHSQPASPGRTSRRSSGS
ncbi:MAG: hypothetical protein ACI8XM_001674 [Haloarculaceae archaeon]|jgi:hypothetical protein